MSTSPKPDIAEQAEHRWPEWMDLKSLCLYASACERTLRDWIHRSNDPLPASQVGNKIRVSRVAFDVWMERQAVRPEAVDVGRIVEGIISDVTGGADGR